MNQSDSIKTKLGNPCCERIISDIVNALVQRSFIDTDGDYYSPGLSHDELWDIIEKCRDRSISCKSPNTVDTIRELRNALFVAANRYHDLHNRCECVQQNETQFRSLVEYALKISDGFKPDYETGDPLDWRRRKE